MKKIFFLFCLWLLLPGALQAAQIIRGPYLEDVTQNTIILKWQTDTASPSWLEYGPTPNCNQIMTLTPSGYSHRAVLYGLVPNQDFCYRVYVENNAKTGVQNPVEGSFRTLFSAERKIVNFLAIGSTASSAQISSEIDLTGDLSQSADAAAAPRAELGALMAQHNADFLIHTGNLTHSGLNQDANKEFFAPLREVLKKTPLFVALGPNEYGPSRQNKDSQTFLRTNYSRYHDMTWSNATPKYYSFDTANARFVFLDTNITQGAVWAPELGEESAQIKWLKTTLAGAPEKWKIVVMNTPAYSTGANGFNQEVRDRLSKIFEDYRVKLVLQGGDADYERTFPMLRGETNQRGVTYVTLGTAGPTPTKRVSSDPSTARFVATPHYAVGKIVDHKLTLTVYSNTGKQLDKLEIYL
ncbi:MAG: metallophosphoesterase [Elusimicrobiaceae bacterium]|nr:metallophosphoesterase [Elusimicrobiaceae bacterium]